MCALNIESNIKANYQKECVPQLNFGIELRYSQDQLDLWKKTADNSNTKLSYTKKNNQQLQRKNVTVTPRGNSYLYLIQI